MSLSNDHDPLPTVDTNTLSPSSWVTKEKLFQLMTLARDASFPNAQIRAICDTLTADNFDNSIDLLRRLHAVPSTPVPPRQPNTIQAVMPKYATSVRIPNPSEVGAVICARTFYDLCQDDIKKLRCLATFCPFSLASRKCMHGEKCQLEQICWVHNHQDMFCFRQLLTHPLVHHLQVSSHMSPLASSYAHL
jgi:hypothetical protein